MRNAYVYALRITPYSLPAYRKPPPLPTPHQDAIREIVESVLASRKYQTIAPDLIHAIAAAEMAKGRSRKDALKATKNQLHQSAAAYQAGRMAYDSWLLDLRQSHEDANAEEFRTRLRAILAHHASTAERLPILDDFYRTILADLPPLRSVLDVACGLNPLTLPWMGLPADVIYYACDIYGDQIHFLNEFFHLAGIQGLAEVRNVLDQPPTQHVDLALVLKTIPCLEQMDRSAGVRLLDAINARYLLVSFPVRSLGGRAKGMSASYEAHFEKLAAGRDWSINRFEFDGELAFLVTTRSGTVDHR
jgi:16S rRNA (guanine(1405)-N(7))-methyltransferase